MNRLRMQRGRGNTRIRRKNACTVAFACCSNLGLGVLISQVYSACALGR